LPDFSPTYAPADGDILDPTGLNNNFFRVTSGRSIYEIANGHIEAVNFDAAFEVGAVHVRPGQAGEGVSVGQVLSNDYFSDLSLGDADYVAIVGATITFRQRYPVSLALLSASGFCTVWRQFGANTGAFDTRAAAPDIHVQAFIASGTGEMSLLGHTKRELPQTVHFDGTSAAPAPLAEIVTREQRLTRHFNLVHPKVAGGSGVHTALTAGWHTYGLAVLVRQNASGQDTSDANEPYQLVLNGAGSADARPTTYYSAIHRVRMYVRNASAVRLL
jgi:hypothetical protein